MCIKRNRLGFTLVETMVATAIATLVFLAIAGTVLFCQRMFRLTVAEAESSLVMREIRDKILFRAGPNLNSGLLTGKASADSASITNSWEDTLEDSSCIRLVWNTSNEGNKFFNERVAHTPVNQNWFSPAGWFKPNSHWLVLQDWAHTVDLPRIRLDLISPDDATIHQNTWILLPQ